MRKYFFVLGLVLSFYFSEDRVFAQDLNRSASQYSVTFAGKAGGDVTKKEFNQAKKLVVSSADGDTSWKVVSYKAAIAGKGTTYREFNMENEAVPPQLDSIVQRTQAGAKIYFEYITIGKKGDVSVLHLSPLSFKLVE